MQFLRVSVPVHLARNHWLLSALILFSLLALTANAQSQVVQYGDRTSFNAAADSTTLFTFDGNAPKNDITLYPSGLTLQGVSFVGRDQPVAVVDPGFGAGDPFKGHQYLVGLFEVNLTLPAGVTAFGADFADYGGGSESTLTAVVNGKSFTFTVPGASSDSSAFAGFTSNVPITSLSFSGGTYGPALANVNFGPASPAPAPEASTSVSLGLLLVLGLGGVIIAKRKKAGAAI